MYKKVYLITQEVEESNLEYIFDYIKKKYDSEVIKVSANKIFEEKDNEDILFLLYLDDKTIKHFFKNHLNKNISIGILPSDNCSMTIKNYAISKNLDEAIDDAFNSELLSSIDILICNEEIALKHISIGDMHGMNRLDYNKNSS